MSKCICVIISTPFQLLSAFSIKENNPQYEVDLYIIGNFKNYNTIADKVKRSNFFTNVVAYSLNDIRKGSYSKIAFYRAAMRQLSYINFEDTGRKIAVHNREYSDVYYAAAVSASELIMYFQKHYHPKFYLFDDGIMTYRDIKWVTGEREKIQIIKNMIFRRIGTPNPHIIVYSPELFQSMHPEYQNVSKLNVISLKSRELISEIFEFSKADAIEQKMVIIECKTDDYLTKKATNELEKIYEGLLGITGIQNIAFKRHPRDTREIDQNRKYLTGSVPFELFSCVQDLSKNILVAWDSTAVLTPKLFYNQEPTVILLYRLVKGKINNYNQTDNLYNAFSEIYSDKLKFLIPNNKNEFAKMIDLLMEKVNGND